MRTRALPALLMLSAFAFAVGQTGLTPVRAQSAPVEKQQTPRQADQSRAQDRSRAQGVKIGRDWKARESANNRAAPAATNREHETVGRDWRAHPEGQDR